MRARRRDDPDATVGGLQVVQGIEALSDLGVPQALLYDVVGIDGATLESGVRVPVADVRRLFAVTERRTGDHLAGLHAAERVEFRGPLGYLLMSCPKLRRGLELYTRLSTVAVDRQRMVLEERGGIAGIRFDLDVGTPRENRHLMDYIMMGTVRTLRRAAPEFRLLDVRTRHAAAGAAAEAARAFGCPVRFGQPEYRVSFPSGILDARSRMSNPLIGEQLERSVTSLTSGSPTSDLRARVEAAVRAGLAGGRRPDVAIVARRLHMSRRTLQRRLDEGDLTFSAVRDGVLREIAEAELRGSILAVKEIAASVGFTDVATFSKAFRRWAGCSPSDFRARGRARLRCRGAAGTC